MSHSLPSLDIDAGGSFTDAEGSTIEGTYVNGGGELCAVWGNIETLYSASFTGSIYCLTCASLLIQHLTCSKSTRMSFFVLRMPSWNCLSWCVREWFRTISSWRLRVQIMRRHGSCCLSICTVMPMWPNWGSTAELLYQPTVTLRCRISGRRCCVICHQKVC